MFAPAPGSVSELMQRAQSLAGLTLAQIARKQQRRVPGDLRRDKGWVGQLIEASLGASAANLPEPDFPQLGVELKTIPVSVTGQPTESTFVCSVPLLDAGLDWKSSPVYRKLCRVLWLPIEAAPEIPLAQRRIGTPLLWSPAAPEEHALRADWEDLMELICRGQVEAITAHHGEYLQIRPKAANARERCWAIDGNGERFRTLPRGFYLRTCFTGAILEHNFILPVS